MISWSYLFFVSFLLLHVNNGLEIHKQRQTNKYANTDFLNHESGYNSEGSKRDYVSSLKPWNNHPGDLPKIETSDYNSQFPALGRPSSNQPNSNPISNKHEVGGQHGSQSQMSNGKRDYVAPQYSTLKPSQHTSNTLKSMIDRHNSDSSKSQPPSDYNSQFPALGRPSSNQSTSNPILNKQVAGGIPGPQSQLPSEKRDYVAPQYTTLKPSQQSSSKVKDLVIFYENKDKTTAKPWSFSSIVAGTTKPGQVLQPSTGKPGASTSLVTTNKPSTLPSQILNKNQVNRGNGNDTTDAEIIAISEELLKRDTNNAAKYITINFQGKTSGSSKEDHAQQPLLTVPQNVWSIPTIQKFLPLLDNYVRDTLVNEHVTPQERNEENAFLDEIMTTNVIRHLMNFLKEKGYVSRDPKQQRDFLKQLWFSLYSRGKGKLSSSSFEHIFVSELKNNQVSGLHNWVYFSKEETANRVDYLGYLKYVTLNDNKGAVMKIHFNQQGTDKPVDSMFVGTSPEFEMAIYTLCFVARPDNECKIKLSSKDINIVSHTFRYRSKNYIGSAYPEI